MADIRNFHIDDFLAELAAQLKLSQHKALGELFIGEGKILPQNHGFRSGGLIHYMIRELSGRGDEEEQGHNLSKLTAAQISDATNRFFADPNIQAQLGMQMKTHHLRAIRLADIVTQNILQQNIQLENILQEIEDNNFVVAGNLRRRNWRDPFMHLRRRFLTKKLLRGGSLQRTMNLVAAGADFTDPRLDGNKLAKLIIKYGTDEMLQLAIHAGLNVNAEGLNLLYDALELGDAAKAKILIRSNVSVSQRGFFEKTPLHLVKNTEIAQLLIDHGADVNARDRNNNTPLMRGDSLDIIKILVENNADVNLQNNDGDTTIMYQYNIEIIRFLIGAGADVNKVNVRGLSPLQSAIVKERDKEIIQTLIDAGADPTAIVSSREEHLDGLNIYELLKYSRSIQKEEVRGILQQAEKDWPERANSLRERLGAPSSNITAEEHSAIHERAHHHLFAANCILETAPQRLRRYNPSPTRGLTL